MTRSNLRLAVGSLIVLLASTASMLASSDTPVSAPSARTSGVHDFDFLYGEWRVRHRVKRAGDGEWWEFDGTCTNRGLVEHQANVEEHRFDKPTGVTYGIALRAYDPQTSQWAIWWIDGRTPHGPLDPPVKGRFENGVGTFYSDYVDQGKPMRVRFIWSQITASSARWEQAMSADAGKTWQPNWIMEFSR